MAKAPHIRKQKKSNHRGFLYAACAVIAALTFIILILLLLPSADRNSNPSSEKQADSVFHFFKADPTVPDGVSISDIDVSGLTEKQALRKLSAVYPELPSEQTITFEYGSHILRLTAGEINAHWAVDEAVTAAMKGSSTNVQFCIDRDTVSTRLTSFFKPLGGIYRPAGAWMEGSKPDITNLSELTQTIVFDKGSAGLAVSTEDIIDELITACSQRSYSYQMEALDEIRQPQKLNLQSVFDSICMAPVEPWLDHETMTPQQGKPGYGFDIEEVQLLLENTDIVRVPLQQLDPLLSLEDVWFLDLLGGYRTEYTDNENRNNNLRLACEKLNGLVLKPGESLSYNQLLGKRTTAAGYLPAPSYVGTELSEEVGGGICQVSSTLYLSSLLAELTITDRRNHGYPVDYIPLGLDATVNWGTTDLKIRNDRKYAVKILAAAENGYVTILIMGVEDRNYTVKYEYRVDDHPSYASAYRCRYDLNTGEEIYRKLDHTSIYLEDVWCWPGYASTNLN